MSSAPADPIERLDAPAPIATLPGPVAPSTLPRPRATPGATIPYHLGRHLRASVAFLVLTVLTVSLAYPIALVGFGELVNPAGANGSLTYYANGTVNGSSLLPPNTTATHGGVVFGDPWAPHLAPVVPAGTPPSPSAATSAAGCGCPRANGSSGTPVWVLAPTGKAGRGT